MLADLAGMLATKTSMVWQLVCSSVLVGSETSRFSSPGYVSLNSFAGCVRMVVETGGEPI